MTTQGQWLLQTIESNAIGAAVGAIVGGTVSGLYKRAVRLEARRIEQALLTLDHLLGGNAAATPIPRKGTMNLTLAQYRKGIAAGFGVILTGLLTWAESADLEPILGPLVPEPFRPLVGVVLGGIALTASVILTSNAPKPATDSDPVQTDEPEPAGLPTRTAAPGSGSAALAQLVAGVTATTSAPTGETSVITLLDPPTIRAYR